MIYVGSNGFYYRNKQDYGVSGYSIREDEAVITQSLSVYEETEQKGYSVELLSSKLGLSASLSLYDIYNLYFAGDVISDFDMVQCLFDYVLKEGSLCYCFKVMNTFCWFYVGINNKVTKIDSISCTSLKTEYELGCLVRKLRYMVASRGYYVAKYYLDSDMGGYLSPFVDIKSLFWGLYPVDALYMLSTMLSDNMICTAENLVNLIRFVDSYGEDGVVLRKRVGKDFTLCRSPHIGETGSVYGLVIDCEGLQGGSGVLDDGCREIGGVIWCRHGKVAVGFDIFSSDAVLFEDTILRVIQNVRAYTGVRKVPVLTFGASDKKLFLASAKKLCSQRNYKKILDTFLFIDCRHFISDFKLVSDKRATLANIARECGASVLVPRHKAVNDARTLFNVLAMILYKTGKFVI